MRLNGFFCLFLALMLLSTGCRKKPATTTTPLHWAANEGHKQAVELLIAKGTDVNAKKNNGDTPLHDAALRGHREIVELLLVNGVDVTAKDNTGRTSADKDARRGHDDVVVLKPARNEGVGAAPCGRPSIDNEPGQHPGLPLQQTEIDISALYMTTDTPLERCVMLSRIRRRFGGFVLYIRR